MDSRSTVRRIGVLLPVYNGGAFLNAAIDSILKQTYADFDFYIINDGSTDKSDEIIKSYTDDRIHYLVNDKNRGLIYTLNRGLDSIQNEFVARMDQDDIAFPDRFEKQIKFMEKHEDIVASGTQVQYFGSSQVKPTYPSEHDEIRARLIMANAIVHPTAFVRSSFLREHNIRYNEDHTYLEDYGFWLSVSRLGKLANHSEILLNYRWHGQNMTAEGKDKREERYKKMYNEILAELEIEPLDKTKQCHLELALRTNTIEDVVRVYQHMNLLIDQNEKLRIYPSKELKTFLYQHWDKLFFKVRDSSLRQTFKYWRLRKKIKFSEIRYAISRLFNRKE